MPTCSVGIAIKMCQGPGTSASDTPRADGSNLWLITMVSVAVATWLVSHVITYGNFAAEDHESAIQPITTFWRIQAVLHNTVGIVA